MASTLSETVQSWFRSVVNLFRPKQTLDTMSKDDLRKQKSTLERNERKLVKQLEKLEAQKTQLFQEAKQEPSESVRRAKARQIRDIDQRVQGLNAVLGPLGQRISMLDRLIAQYDMGQFAKGSSELIDILHETDAQSLQQKMDQALTEELLQNEKVDSMLETFRTASERDAEIYEEDEEVLAILGNIEQSAAMDASVEEAALLKEQTPSQTDSASPEKESPIEE